MAQPTHDLFPLPAKHTLERAEARELQQFVRCETGGRQGSSEAALLIQLNYYAVYISLAFIVVA